MLSPSATGEEPEESCHSISYDQSNLKQSAATREAEAVCGGNGEAEKLGVSSKSQMKKRLRRAACLLLRDERQARKKKRKKELQESKKQKKREEGGEGGVASANLIEKKGISDFTDGEPDRVDNLVRKTPKENRERSNQRKQEFLVKCRKNATIVIDCHFQGLQTEKELTSLSQQLMYSYGTNRTADCPFNLVICGIYDELQHSLERISGYANWNCKKSSLPCDVLFGWNPQISSPEGQPGARSVGEVGGVLEPRKGDGRQEGVDDQQPQTAESTALDSGLDFLRGDITQQRAPERTVDLSPSAPSSGSPSKGFDGDSTEASLSDAFVTIASEEGLVRKLRSVDRLRDDDASCGDHTPPKDRFIYLTADSETVLESLDAACVYILGGLVDRNRYPGITAKRAVEWNISTARLPIQDWCSLNGSRILTVNQVFGILSKFVKSRNWKDAISAIIPSRKLKADKLSSQNKIQDDDG